MIDSMERRVERRVAEMKRKQDEKFDRIKAERERVERIKLIPRNILNELAEQLAPVFRSSLACKTGGYFKSWYNADTSQVPTYKPTLYIAAENASTTLAEFVVDGNFETGELYLTHDGDRVTLDQAVDLALAVIEANLYC